MLQLFLGDLHETVLVVGEWQDVANERTLDAENVPTRRGTSKMNLSETLTLGLLKACLRIVIRFGMIV